MDLQKVKEALKRAGAMLKSQMYNTDYIVEALDELEKPVDDEADHVASRIEEIQFLLNDGSIMERRHKQMVDVIQQYAEQYHAKKCADSWIDVVSRVPDCNENGESDYVLVYDSYNDEVKVGFYWKVGKVFSSQDGDEDLEGVTHWQPLPQEHRA